MSTRSISRRYARALLELANEGVAVHQGLNKLAAVAGAGDAAIVLDDPQLPSKVKVKILDKAVGGLSKELSRLAEMLCERGKTALLPEIAEVFEEMLREAEAEVVADVVVADKLDTEARKKLADAISKSVGKKVRLEISDDPNILGGMVVCIGDRQIDHSVRGKLDGLRRAIAA